MPHIQVRDVPPDVHRALVQRADAAGQSLQQYLRAQLEELAATPALDDVLDRIEGRPKGSVSARHALAARDATRARR